MNTKRFVSIRVKVLVLLFFCILVPFLFYWFFSYYYIRTSLDEEFVSQTTNTMTAAGASISDYLELADYTARGLYFNSEVMDILADQDPDDSSYQQLQTEARIFDFMQMLYSSVPDASQIHLSAFHLKKSLLLQADMQRYEKSHIYLSQERTFPCAPYHSYISATHMQSDYNFVNLPEREFSLVFSVNLPIYQIPSTTDVLGEISIDIPISVLEEICDPLYQSQETLCIIDGNGNFIYSSRPADITTQVKNPLFQELASMELSTENAQVAESDSDDIIICSRIPLEPADWYLIKISPKSFVYAKANHFFNLMLYSFLAVTAAEVLLICIAVFHFTSPLKKATVYARAVTAGNLNAKMSDYITYSQNDEIGSLLVAIRKMIHSIRSFTIRQYQLELANRTSELKALQAQINPHFIHNTLQCLATSALEGGNVSLYQSITDLGQMMHYSMDTRRSLVPITDALRYIDLYLRLQKLRFPSTMTSRFIIPEETKGLLIPKMTLQPLVENSILHGNLLKLENSCLTIRTALNGHILHIWVEDTGTGITFEKLNALNASLREVRASMANADVQAFVTSLDSPNTNAEAANTAQHNPADEQLDQAKRQRFVSNRIGVPNVYQRLLLYFQNQCTMEYLSNQDCGTTVHIQIDHRMLNTGENSRRSEESEHEREREEKHESADR